MKEETPRANRFHIGVFGRRNSGKSSLVNALAGQQAAIVSDVPGTTVRRAGDDDGCRDEEHRVAGHRGGGAGGHGRV